MLKERYSYSKHHRDNKKWRENEDKNGGKVKGKGLWQEGEVKEKKATKLSGTRRLRLIISN